MSNCEQIVLGRGGFLLHKMLTGLVAMPVFRVLPLGDHAHALALGCDGVAPPKWYLRLV